MVVLECAAFLVLQEDAGNAADGKWIVVAVGGQLPAVQRLEEMLLLIYLLKEAIFRHTGITYFAILDGIVVADHIDVEQVNDLFQRDEGMLGKVGRAAQIGVFARECHEIHIVFGRAAGIMRRQSNDGRRAGGVVICPGVIDFAAQVAQMVIVCSENVAAVVTAPFDLRDHIEKLIILEEFIFNVHLHAFHTLDRFRRHPDDGLVHHLLSVGLKELDRRGPGVEQAGIGAGSGLLQLGKHVAVTVRKPEVAAYQAAGIFRLRQILEQPVAVEIQRIHVIHREFALYARRILPHREIDSRAELFTVSPHFHSSAKCIYVNGEGLDRHFVHPHPAEFLLQILPGLVGASPRVSAALIFCAAEFLDHPLEMRQILRTELQGSKCQQND